MTLDASNLAWGDSQNVLDNPALWTPRMPRPSDVDVEGFQRRIDSIVGRSEERSILKLVWMPEVMKWRPHALHESPRGYDLPQYLALWDSTGQEVAAPRWAVCELDEPEHYRGAWDNSRWRVIDNQLYDVRGPCPAIRYTPLWRVLYHDRFCCELLNGEACWGYYMEPDSELLARIQKAYDHTRADSDIQPHAAPDEFDAPNARREVKNDLEAEERERDEQLTRILAEAERKRTMYSLPDGNFNRTSSGLYLPN